MTTGNDAGTPAAGAQGQGTGTPPPAGGSSGSGAPPGGGDTAERHQLMRGEAYSNAGHPDHAATVERVNALSKKVFGDGTGDATPPLYASVPRPALPPGTEDAWPEDAETFLRREGQALGLTDKHLQHLLGALAKDVIADRQQEQASISAGLHALRERWGEAFERRLGQARAAVNQFDPGLAELLESSGLGNHPAFIEVFAALGESMKERGLMVNEVNDSTSIEDAQKELRRLMASEPYLDGGHRNHKAVVDNVNKLAQRVYGEQTAAID